MRTNGILQHIRPQGVVLTMSVLLLAGFVLWPSQPSAANVPVQTVETSTATSTSAEPVITANCEATKCLALTFDDGPDASLTPHILDTLKRHNAKATFFVLGSHVGGNEALLQRIHQEGHEIGNHSWSHPYFTRISPDQVRSEVLGTQAAITKAGVPAPHIFRPPYGDMNDIVVSQIPMSVVRWNIDPEDWHPKRQQQLVEHMAVHARPGAVVVMHDTEVTTAERLDLLLTQLESQQFTLVTVSTMLGLSPGQQGVYFAR